MPDLQTTDPGPRDHALQQAAQNAAEADVYFEHP